ncbi:hypothetical protein KAU55_00575 [Candidatus Bathyarchaeota archaeon]|nr:hypothetical protein [Candidatus Bathyarchaeota archaeon]
MSSSIRETREEVKRLRREMESLERQLGSTRNVLNSTLLLMRKMNLPPDLNRAMSLFVRGRMVAEQFIRTLQLLAAAQAASGPMGWAVAGLTMGVTLFAYSDLVGDMQG